jgi:hypothetical protein
MNPFARINLSSVLSSVLSSLALAEEDALRRGIFVSSLALATVAEAKLAPPKLEDYTHECKKCGAATLFLLREKR